MQTSTIGQVTGQIFDPHVNPQTAPPEDGRNGVFIRNFGKFEREGSTFHWKIFRPNLEKLIGYSKPRNMAEKANKQELLMDCVKRLAKNGYLKPGYRIEFYRAYDATNDDLSVKLFTLTSVRFTPEACVVGEAWLIAFLKNLYSPPVHYYNADSPLFPTGGRNEPPAGTALIPDTKKQGARLDDFDMSRNFRDVDALLRYTEVLKKKGHAHELVHNFYREQVKRFNPGQLS